ncbi:uncharacterized protein HMPREF1541_10095 [Cyphellophora europaea CBS 101466]|uniref:Uncharacterized protein n=1 Tax=Cyphellophora europaea (strain CBS 101466) TaxID=1220924 RepID=W2SB14_CYPE1|nr:uncharacterized protein HMPREF1541_10095 [Cyphellophora europaea CBS 101466]ETN45218.1 hypothetical protein HMPREF1541_10095 [Cyphellophora europaea CBS 101466]
MPSLRSNPKPTAQYVEYVQNLTATRGTQASYTNEMASNIADKSKPSLASDRRSSTKSPAPKVATTEVSGTTNEPQSTDQAQSQANVQLKTPPVTPPASDPPTPIVPDTPEPGVALPELTKKQKAGIRAYHDLVEKHRRMGAYGWSGVGKKGAMHSGRKHDYNQQGTNRLITKKELDEDRASLAAVGIVIEGL